MSKLFCEAFFWGGVGETTVSINVPHEMGPDYCRAMMTNGMVFKIHVDTWVYSKEDTMAHTRRLVVIS